MAEPAHPEKSAPKRKKKLSRKDIAELSGKELRQVTIETYKKLLAYIKPYKGRMILGLAFAILAGIFNLVMIVGFRAVFSIILPGETQSKVIKVPFLGDIDPMSWFQLPEDEADFWLVIGACAAIPVILFIRGLLNYLSNYCRIWVSAKTLYDLRSHLFSKLMGHSLPFYNSAKTGELMQTVFNQTRMASNASITLVFDLIRHPISILFIILALIWIDPFFTFYSLVIFPLCLLPVMAVSRKVRKAGGKEEQEAGQLMVTMQESFAGIRVVKGHGREEHELGKFNLASKKMTAFIMRWQKAMEIVGPLVETVASAGIAIGLFYAWKKQIPAKDFMVMFLALTQIYPHAKALSRLQILLQKCIVASSTVFRIIEEEPDVPDKPDAKALEQCQGGIKFDNVSFAYKKDIPAVQNIDLDIEAGQYIALVGPSGAGKSTLFSLLLRFYEPSQGKVLVDGTDIRDLQQTSLRDHIGMVNQDTFLFHDTIYNNILYGKLDATQEEVMAAAKKAHAHDFIMEQEKGYETEIGDKGCQLSGGQQQRLSIARAILRNAPILLLDEATSALDSESEKAIQEAIHTLSEGKTVIAIAHRLSTIREADRIIVMENAQVQAQGTHDELLKSSETYKRLYELQFHGQG